MLRCRGHTRAWVGAARLTRHAIALCVALTPDPTSLRTRSTEHADLSITSLRAELLAPLDVLVLCTTEGPALSEPELAALRSWVEAGGALIVSAFSNWSAHNHFAAQTVGWLGLQTMPLASFGGITVMSSVI